MKNKVSLLYVACNFCIFCLTGTALAFSIPIGSGDISSNATIIDFNSMGNEIQISSQYTGQGVTFSGALYSLDDSNSGDIQFFPANGGGVVASNWLYSQSVNQGLSFEADFSSLVNKVGFYLENYSNQTATIEIFNGTSSLGSISFNTSSLLVAEFKGIESSSPFDRMVFTNDSTSNGFYAIDDFRFELAGAPIPEPATMLLFGAGFAGLAAVCRKRKG